MSDPFLGEIKLVSFTFPPQGWAFCDGQQLPINQNQALYSLLGTQYGGNGVTTFALPNLQGRIPVHQGAGLWVGTTGGEAAHTLTVAELPGHGHPAAGAAAPSSPGTSPAGAVWAGGRPAYGPVVDTVLHAEAVAAVGGSQPHENQAPYLALNFVIALTGVFPSRN